MTGTDEPVEQSVLDRTLIERLEADVLQALELANKSDSQFYRRVFIYTVFSAIEATVYRLKRATLYWSRYLGRQTDVSAADLAALKDETYLLSDAGKARARPMRAPLPANIRFSFEAFTRINGVACPVDFDSSDWKGLITAVSIRHRVTHPKHASDLEISREEMKIVGDATIWFRRTHLEVMQAVYEADRERLKAIETQEAELKRRLEALAEAE
jgi:hypothetical protein